MTSGQGRIGGAILILACIIELLANLSKACCTQRKTEAHILLAFRLSLILLIILWHCCAVEWFSLEAELVWRD
jgi:hypothetical protein